MTLVRRELDGFHLKETELSLCYTWCGSWCFKRIPYGSMAIVTYMASRRQGYGLASHCN